MPLFCRTVLRRISPSPNRRYTKTASATLATVAASMAVYSATVTKRAEPGPAPEDYGAKSHHVTDRDGKVTKFKNPHPSYKSAAGFGLFSLLLCVCFSPPPGRSLI